jgi:hypothetical protein
MIFHFVFNSNSFNKRKSFVNRWGDQNAREKNSRGKKAKNKSEKKKLEEKNLYFIKDKTWKVLNNTTIACGFDRSKRLMTRRATEMKRFEVMEHFDAALGVFFREMSFFKTPACRKTRLSPSKASERCESQDLDIFMETK